LWAEYRTPRVPTPSIESSLGARLLPTVLSIIAGSVDAIGFLGLGGLFTAHVTGNLVILAAHLVSDSGAPVAPLLSVPVFVATLALQLRFWEMSESMGNHDSNVVGAGRVG